MTQIEPCPWSSLNATPGPGSEGGAAVVREMALDYNTARKEPTFVGFLIKTAVVQVDPCPWATCHCWQKYHTNAHTNSMGKSVKSIGLGKVGCHKLIKNIAARAGN